jgi:uncharacterized protein YacL
MRVSIVRAAYVALILGLALYGFLTYLADESGYPLNAENRLKTLMASVVVLLIGMFALYVDLRDTNKQMTSISAMGFGMLAGLLLGALLWLILKPFVEMWFVPPMTNFAPFLISLVSCYICVSFLLQTKDEFRFLIPYVEFSKQVKGGKPLVLDTSVIIDGRIADICDTGIIDATLVVPRFVLQELQGIADSSDKLKRNRGRRGLDILKRLQSITTLELVMHDGNLPELHDIDPKMRVDERLVLFTKALSGRVVTNDFNLNKIAQLQGVNVINLNEVANALKTVALPGELMLIRIVKAGDQLGQGVGYLEDGTMVVVEHGKNQIGNQVHITVTSVLQTPAGRMIFGKIEGKNVLAGSGAHDAVKGPETKA